ncbi:MAG: hypothetical protein V4498_10190 [candidate division FCPU426 bacterium]
MSKPCIHPVRLVAVDGGAGAGKTTFAAKLALALGGAPVVPMDDFNAFDDLVEYWPRLEEQILSPLFAGKSFRYQKRDWVHDMAGRGLADWREIPFSPLLILEGIGAARRQVASRLAYAVWISAPSALRLQRGITRDSGVEDIQSIWERFMPGEQKFFEEDGTRERADLVVDGALPYEADGGVFHVLKERLDGF